MKIIVNTKTIQLIGYEELTSGAYNDTSIEVELSDEYANLTVFVSFNDKKTLVSDGKVFTPCLQEGLCKIGVYGVSVKDGEAVLRYSPKPVEIMVAAGSWNSQLAEADAPTASEAEKIYSLINDAIEKGKLKGDKGDSYILTDADKAEIAQKVNLPTKTSSLVNDSGFVSDSAYVHTDNNYTDEDKTKLAELSNYDDTAVKKNIAAKQDKLSQAQINNITAVPNKQDKLTVSSGLKLENNVLSLDIETATASTTYGGDTQ